MSEPDGPAPPAPYFGQPPSNKLAIAALVLGIVAVVLFWFPILDWLLAILAIVLGGVATRRAKDAASLRGKAVAGVILGITSLALWGVFFVISIVP